LFGELRKSRGSAARVSLAGGDEYLYEYEFSDPPSFGGEAAEGGGGGGAKAKAAQAGAAAAQAALRSEVASLQDDLTALRLELADAKAAVKRGLREVRTLRGAGLGDRSRRCTCRVRVGLGVGLLRHGKVQSLLSLPRV
jgi:hypothetical protein